MTYSRRDLPLLLPALALARGAAQGTAIPAKVYRFEDLTARTNNKNRSWNVFNGDNHAGIHIDLHETELAPGEMPHPAHHHVHEEILMLHTGTLEVMMGGNTTKIGPGSVVYAASNEEHGWRNVGTTPAHYFVFALGRDK